MPGIEIKGRSKIANYRHGGRAGFVHGSVAKVAKIAARKFRKPKPHRDKPPSKTHKDVPTMAAEGGRIGLKDGSKRFVKGTKREKQILVAKDRPTEGTKLILHKGTKPYTPEGEKVGKRIGLKKGGSDKKWIQKAVDPKHKGYCTPMTKKTCTPARKALARTFKKKAKTGWG